MPQTDPPLPGPVIDAAAAWFAKRDAGCFTAVDQQALDAWIAADPAHAQAWQRLNLLWVGLDAAPADLRDAAGRRVVVWQARRARRTRRLVGGAALLVLLAVLAGADGMLLRLRADIRTAQAERRELSLPDGTVVHLNGGSAIALDYTTDHRGVILLAGEAAFDVVPDPVRPLSVEAAGGSATALGTRFVVRRLDKGARVTVMQHSVAVRPAPGAETTVVGEGRSVAYDGDGRLTELGTGETWAATGWLSGVLVFEDRPLGEVVAEIGRYHPGLVRVLGGRAAARRISGVFPIDDPVGALEGIERSLGLRSLRLGDRLVLLFDGP